MLKCINPASHITYVISPVSHITYPLSHAIHCVYALLHSSPIPLVVQYTKYSHYILYSVPLSVRTLPQKLKHLLEQSLEQSTCSGPVLSQVCPPVEIYELRNCSDCE